MNKKLEKLREASSTELNDQLKSAKEELFNLRFQQATGQLANPLVIKSCKKNIARINTLLREQELKKA